MASAIPIRQVTFQNRRWPGLGLEVLWLSGLWRRIPLEASPQPEQRDFHVLLLCTAGSGQFQLDFSPLELERGMMVHVRPGQVVQQLRRGNLEGRIALFRPAFLDPEASTCEIPSLRTLGSSEFRTVERAFSDLQSEYTGTDASPEALLLLRDLLQVVLHRWALMAGRSLQPLEHHPAQEELLRQFRQELEAAFRSARRVSHYAKRLGYAEKTLNRATHQLVGVPAKILIDARILLEARRLLVHTRLPVGAIARELGFSEPTNFAKFFRKGAGCGPSAFRRNHLGE